MRMHIPRTLDPHLSPGPVLQQVSVADVLPAIIVIIWDVDLMDKQCPAGLQVMSRSF